jgi:hypothetical protein
MFPSFSIFLASKVDVSTNFPDIFQIISTTFLKTKKPQ